ncbi:gag protein [Tanacetum coccineum]
MRIDRGSSSTLNINGSVVIDLLGRWRASSRKRYRPPLSNIYARNWGIGLACGCRVEDVKNTGSGKPSGASLIELDDGVHEFTVKNTVHPASDKIYHMGHFCGCGITIYALGDMANGGGFAKCWTQPFTRLTSLILLYILDGLKVPSNLKSYDGLSDPNDHLTMFMGTMDVHRLPEPAWCRIFSITLCGAARFWYDNLSPGSIDNFHQLRDKFRANFLQQRRFQQVEILGIRQKSKESLKDYLARFGKETLHMVDRSGGMMTGAFISGLRPGRAFKELIAQPPKSLKDLYIYINGFIRTEEANDANRFHDSKK